MNDLNDDRQHGREPPKIGKLIAVGVFLVIMITAMWTLPLDDWLDRAQGWSALHPVEGRLLYIGFFILAACLMVPGSVLFMSGGYLFGFWWGGLLAAIATPLAASAAFLVGSTIAARRWPRWWHVIRVSRRLIRRWMKRVG